ncbi:hypothetical protein NKG05_28195 [Oerskovia sp. M15]
MGRHLARRHDTGEYTQLTGRAGRRGIDVEGTPSSSTTRARPRRPGGLASKRLYPLKSSFRPTYNMAVNLVAQVGRERARDVLETSFAQFQADRGVVGLAKQAQAHAEALEGYAQAMTCDRGDFSSTPGCVVRSPPGRQTCPSPRSGPARADRHGLREPADRRRRRAAHGRRAGYVVVLDPGQDGGFDGPRPTVLTEDKQVKKLTVADAPSGIRTVGRVRIPKTFNPRVPAARRDLASSLRNALGAFADVPGAPAHGKARVRAAAADDKELTRLRASCAPTLPRLPRPRGPRPLGRAVDQLKKEHDALVRRVEGRTGSIARVFDRICDILMGLGYLEVDTHPAGGGPLEDAPTRRMPTAPAARSCPPGRGPAPRSR